MGDSLRVLKWLHRHRPNPKQGAGGVNAFAGNHTDPVDWAGRDLLSLSPD